jgi:hypothetical protein
VMHYPEADPIQPAPAAHERVGGVSRRVEKYQRRPGKAQSLYHDLVPERLERARDGSIAPLDSGLGEPEDACIRSVEKTIRGACVEPRTQFHAAVAVNQPYGNEYSS